MASTGDLDLATSGDFLMATDSREVISVCELPGSAG